MRDAPEKCVHVIDRLAGGRNWRDSDQVSLGREDVLVWDGNNGRWHRENIRQICLRAREFDSLIDALGDSGDDLILDVADWYANGITFKVIADDNLEATEKWLKRAVEEMLAKRDEWQKDYWETAIEIVSAMQIDLEETNHRWLKKELARAETALGDWVSPESAAYFATKPQKS